jgi:hypothetical protein
MRFARDTAAGPRSLRSSADHANRKSECRGGFATHHSPLVCHFCSPMRDGAATRGQSGFEMGSRSRLGSWGLIRWAAHCERQSPHTRARTSPSASPARRRRFGFRQRLGFGRGHGSKRNKKRVKRTGEQKGQAERWRVVVKGGAIGNGVGCRGVESRR